MGKVKNGILAALGMGAVALANPANAATVIETYEFEASTDGPITEHSGSFSFSYDDANPTVLTLLSIDFALGSYVFDLANTGISVFGDGFIIGGTECAVTCIGGGTNDFWLFTDLGFANFTYAVVGSTSAYSDSDPSLRAVSGAVPEPSTWALLLLGFLATGGAMRAARRQGRKSLSLA